MAFELPPIPPPSPGQYTRRPRTKLTVEQQNLYLAHLSQTGLVGHSAELAGVSRQSIADRRDRDASFAAAEEEAKELFKERLELEALRRGFEGYDEELTHQGQATGDTIRKYDTTLAVLALKKHVPEYKDKVQADVNVRGGVMVTPGTMGPEDWAKVFGGERDEEAREDSQQ